MASEISTPAILLRRTDYGDYDLILTCLTLSQGKISLMAKYAKKSRKRFAGALEIFTELNLVWNRPRGRAMPVLREASIANPFGGIRADVLKTAYASYWTEMTTLWLESGTPQEAVFGLLRYALGALDRDAMAAEVLNLIFQVRFLKLAGFLPDLRHCSRCRRSVDAAGPGRFDFEVGSGSLVCPACRPSSAAGRHSLAKGSLMQLLWIAETDLSRVGRMRFAPHQVGEATALLETFIPYHLGRMPRSLKFLRQVRPPGGAGGARHAVS